MAPVYLSTVHHEGAGAPDDFPRGAGGGYSYWLGATHWTFLREPRVSWATLHFNHVSLDICLSGDRDVYPVTDHDLDLLRGIFADAYRRGFVSAQPLVRPHRWTFQTACPGSNTMNRWPDVAACLRTLSSVPAPGPVIPQQGAPAHPTLHPGAHGQPVMGLQHELNVGTGQHLTVDGLFGPQTEAAVHAFQAFFRLVVDGIAGPRTWSMLDYCFALHGGHV